MANLSTFRPNHTRVPGAEASDIIHKSQGMDESSFRFRNQPLYRYDVTKMNVVATHCLRHRGPSVGRSRSRKIPLTTGLPLKQNGLSGLARMGLSQKIMEFHEPQAV